MTATRDHRGYWVVDAAGSVFAFGDADRHSSLRHAHRIRGIVAAPGGGYWLYTRSGNVYPSKGAPFYGSPLRRRGYRGSSITGMAATRDGKGYWLVTATGTVFAFGDAARFSPQRHSRRIRGIVASPTGGFWLYTSHGNIYPVPATPFYGSPRKAGLRGFSLTGMTATPDGHGYWVVDSRGTVRPFGDATTLPTVRHAHPIAGIAR
jgi:hypothetical protein